MQNLKKLIEGKNRWIGLEEQLSLIESNIESNPNIALDGAKTILESLCKTILNDNDVEFSNNIKFSALIKKTFDSLPVFKEITKKDKELAKSILGAFENIARCLGEFRNTYGFFSHGQDLESKKFDNYLINLVVESSDLLSSFLLKSHTEYLIDRKRLYYAEFEEFNNWLDQTEEWTIIRGIECSPSYTLFNSDIEAYKEAYNEFINDTDALIESFEINGVNGNQTIEKIIELKDILNTEQLDNLKNAIKNITNINEEIIDNLNNSKVFELIETIRKNTETITESIEKITKPTRKVSENLGRINNK